MVALSRCLGWVVFVLFGAEGARVSRKRRASTATAIKFIAGVPVLNYDGAYNGESSLSELGSQKDQEWVVVVNPGTSDEQIQAMCKTNKNACNLVGSPQKGGVPFLEMRGTEKDLEEVIHGSHGAVRYVEPDQSLYMIPEIEVPDDAPINDVSLAGTPVRNWGLDRIGNKQRVRAGGGVTIFILDTGVRVTHKEFGGRAVPALDMTRGQPKECNGDMTCAGDKQGHGTHTAGTAAGRTFGVAPAAAVRSVKVLGDKGKGVWSWSYYALDWLATHQTRPAVASMSLGSSGAFQAMKDAVDAAVNAGVIVVVAAGNSNLDACGFSPAFVPSAITVGATDEQDSRSYFSNFGACVNLYAPGSNILSALHYSDSPGTKMSGTSMACPHVAGGAALVLEANPSMKASAVMGKLLDDAVSGRLVDLFVGDNNKLLYVGEGAAPPVSFTQGCPEAISEPNGYGNCLCKLGLRCAMGNTEGCKAKGTVVGGFVPHGKNNRWRFTPACFAANTCMCTSGSSDHLPSWTADVQRPALAQLGKGGRRRR